MLVALADAEPVVPAEALDVPLARDELEAAPGVDDAPAEVTTEPELAVGPEPEPNELVDVPADPGPVEDVVPRLAEVAPEGAGPEAVPQAAEAATAAARIQGGGVNATLEQWRRGRRFRHPIELGVPEYSPARYRCNAGRAAKPARRSARQSPASRRPSSTTRLLQGTPVFRFLAGVRTSRWPFRVRSRCGGPIPPGRAPILDVDLHWIP